MIARRPTLPPAELHRLTLREIAAAVRVEQLPLDVALAELQRRLAAGLPLDGDLRPDGDAGPSSAGGCA